MAAMVGLFWVTPDAVYVGSPPNAIGIGVRLTAEGLEATDPASPRTWTWAELRSAVVEDVPRHDPVGRATKALGAMISAAIGSDYLGEGPPEMKLRLETEEGTHEVTVHSAAAGGYSAGETRLSQELLDRFVAGTAHPRAVEEWGREHAVEGTPDPRAREVLLHAWARQ
ncbi:hypothetical protein DEJ51_32145 [Streptomyces venezuelae]|uniref:Uncharacterized protein n=1 Tax=Streptomyces venezuelae TaxID=54571 RepID=A0A5P2E009_STRVZ|nr:hypothetical protein [Streptomyces venezuelae]QES58219.1 hypothetical protein DEJ51_32145 [Streptomyces venezuelae]